jgi:hypothetical protein
MLPRFTFAALVTLVSALTLSACAGGAFSPVPSGNAAGQLAPGGASSFDRLSTLNSSVQPNAASCSKKKYAYCETVSLKNGLELMWCVGTKKDPCKDTGAYKWSGIVCDAKGATCKKPIPELTAAWTGPFKCKAKDKCTGTWELDTITPGKGLKQNKAYIYKQNIHACKGTKCDNAYIGLNVGP